MNQESTWVRATVIASILIVLMLVANFALPAPKAKGAQDYFNKEKELSTQRLIAEKDKKEFADFNAKKLWNLGPEALGPIAMGKVSNMAKASGLNMVAFRPQRTTAAGDLVRYGYQISLEGSFSKVIEFTRKLETPETRLAVVSLQVASTDGASDAVSATVGVVAYRDREAGLKPELAKSGTDSTLASEKKEKL